MSDWRTSPWWKKAIAWILVSLTSILFGSFVTHIGDTYISPLWSTVIRVVLNTHCCFKARDPIPIQIFAKQMSPLIEGGYVISISPDAEGVKIAAGDYGCKETYLNVAKEVLNRNSRNLRYEINSSYKVIHIMLAD